jgi:DNA topoisomerase-3
METSGKNIEDEELRQLMKENGIGRPSTRANIIETLFRRRYIVRNKKNIVATPTGIELIGTIENELLKSAELTGLWEKKLRQIEAGTYEVATFMTELKEMVIEIVDQVKRSPRRAITVVAEEPKEKGEGTGKGEGKGGDNALNDSKQQITRSKKQATGSQQSKAKITCPKCRKGEIIQGKQAWGCTAFREGCNFRLPFEFAGKKLSEANIKLLCTKRKSGELKGFEKDGAKVDGALILNENYQLELEENLSGPLKCPRCGVGTIIKGKSAWGCSNFRNGCQLRVPFEFAGKKLADSQLQLLILKGKSDKIGFNKEFGLIEI